MKIEIEEELEVILRVGYQARIVEGELYKPAFPVHVAFVIQLCFTSDREKR